MNQSWKDVDIEDLRKAKIQLEHPGLVARLTDLVGTPFEKGIEKLPGGAQVAIQKATQTALHKALGVAVNTLGETVRDKPATMGHKIAVGLAGAAGGAFGLAALAVELPVSTTLILRSIADIAQCEGEDLTDPFAQLACIEVFALGGPLKSDDAAETGYFAVRAALAKAVSQAAKHLANQGMADRGAPVLVRLIALVAKRFSLIVTEKVAATLVPILGAAAGSAINVAFINHFQSMAGGHFTVRRLERQYGQEEVLDKYKSISNY